ncbi:uncharacterized protein MONBRDRAFT_4795 [Monosiga brevicollis MX1]|uniref:Uncharacterized protein n=1 Tax=Monosiga brevicollis TaxID=81824 RepID=A9UNY7_MONBE|nr:uncharacterized protein MONBRDRAFT_4795 [Monosiga brevicollis MX1]EDQ92326.1 predicted protein [Monosiga brevicollis MX1]|eukprot:XP_001742088.1 hypothetical protein [Monosiga brevicollis MX1]
MTLRAELNYSQGPANERPYIHTYERPPELAAASTRPLKTNLEQVPVEVTVHDGRVADPPCAMETHGFTLIQDAQTSLSRDEFYDGNKVRKVYYPEIEAMLCEQLGCGHARVLHHAVRNEELEPNRSDVKGYGLAVHTDANSNASQDLFRQFAPLLDTQYHTGRFLFLNVWRPIGDEPVSNNHLAMCDQRSLVSPDDFVVCDFCLPGTSVEVYRPPPTNASRHTWYCFPRMTRNEAILFKQWDSDPTQLARICYHTAFRDPKAASSAPVRESIEVRCICFFPDHEPNTCPPLPKDPDPIAAAATLVEQAVNMLSAWPAAAQTWIRVSLWLGPWGVRSVARILAQDGQGRFGFAKLTPSEKGLLADRLVERGLAHKLQKGLPPINPWPTLKMVMAIFLGAVPAYWWGHATAPA